MADITLRDLCRWDRRLSLLLPGDMETSAALDHGVSWAVSIRAASPHLPPVRGDELVVMPPRVLAEIRAGEALDPSDLARNLARQGVAAVLTDRDTGEDLSMLVPVLIYPVDLLQEAEPALNRLITRQRAELYRLGNELSRRLSQAALDPRGVEALLASASEVAERSLVLQDGEGNVVAWGGASVIAPAGVGSLAVARSGIGPHLVTDPDQPGSERLITTLAADGRTGYLSLLGAIDKLTERDRLVLQQTAGTCAVLMSQSRSSGADRGRERLVADLLLGRLASEAAAIARAQSLGIDPTAPVVVGLLTGAGGAEPSLSERQLLRRELGRWLNDNGSPVAGGYGFILQGVEPEEAAERLRHLARATVTSSAGSLWIVLSRRLEDIIQAPEGLRQVRYALELRRRGALTGNVIASSAVDDLGLYSLLYPLWGSAAVERYRSELLSALEQYDRQHRQSDLIGTLDVYLSLGGALAEASERLGIHRNTLSYRLQRIEELTGRDLGQPYQRLLLRVALLARNLPCIDEE
ncbi:MAG TPA: helix-turn-helix domain-containing protein [Thermomicrobiaceae bacterium]|nr:helix-turn-helix domain-containing protein [Thermomicrobiaceae bacterium]